MKTLFLLSGMLAAAFAMPQDESKEKAEAPVRKVADVKKKAAIADRGKSRVEMPIKEALDDRNGRLDALRAAIARGLSQPPKAGLVAWHPSFDAAKAAAANSGKPVLLFQLLGKLDDEWC